MVGTGASGDSGSKEAVGMMALHEALRNVCLASDWTYSVFWTIRPRPRCRGGNGCKVGDDNGSLMLMWEDGFCRARVADCHDDFDGGEDPVRRAFSKMSIQLYNYGEGLMGKVASDKCHKWVFKEPSECEPNNISNYWQSSFDAIPPEWSDQFASGIQTIAVIQAGHGLLQLGSCKIIPEDLHFVLRMRHMFESLGYQSGFYLSQLFSSTRTTPPVTPSPIPKQLPARPLANWSHHRPLTSHAFVTNQMGYRKEDSTHMFLPMAHQSSTQLESIVHDHDHDPDLKWPNGLSFFTALTGRVDESKLLFATSDEPHPLTLGGSSTKDKLDHDEGNARDDHVEEYLGLEGHPVGGGGKMGHNFKFKRSFTLPTRGSSSSSPSISSSSLNASYAPMQHSSSGGGGTGNGGGDGIYSDIMETFLE